jgi:hypothetical protein
VEGIIKKGKKRERGEEGKREKKERKRERKRKGERKEGNGKNLWQTPKLPGTKMNTLQGDDLPVQKRTPRDDEGRRTSSHPEGGKHKSAQHREEHVTKALGKDVLHGFSLPILPETVQQIAGAMAQLLGMAKQLTLTESGERVPKFRLMQDLSFALTKKEASVNSRINLNAYMEMIYGWCLARTIHYIVSL